MIGWLNCWENHEELLSRPAEDPPWTLALHHCAEVALSWPAVVIVIWMGAPGTLGTELVGGLSDASSSRLMFPGTFVFLGLWIIGWMLRIYPVLVAYACSSRLHGSAHSNYYTGTRIAIGSWAGFGLPFQSSCHGTGKLVVRLWSYPPPMIAYLPCDSCRPRFACIAVG